MNECSYTRHNRPRPGELKTWYFPVSHLWKLENGSALRPTPGEHRIKQGLDLRLDHLKLLVACAQRAMGWSIYVWTLLSHSNQVYVNASCVGPCQRPLRNPWWSKLFACAPIHRTIQVADDIVHKLHQSFTRPPTLKPVLTVSKYAI